MTTLIGKRTCDNCGKVIKQAYLGLCISCFRSSLKKPRQTLIPKGKKFQEGMKDE